jgi:hypothetical protein
VVVDEGVVTAAGRVAAVTWATTGAVAADEVAVDARVAGVVTAAGGVVGVTRAKTAAVAADKLAVDAVVAGVAAVTWATTGKEKLQLEEQTGGWGWVLKPGKEKLQL